MVQKTPLTFISTFTLTFTSTNQQLNNSTTQQAASKSPPFHPSPFVPFPSFTTLAVPIASKNPFFFSLRNVSPKTTIT
jgi:hypothetical protein